MKNTTKKIETNNDKESIYAKALIISFNAHSGQIRRITREQFIIHPIKVSEIINQNFNYLPKKELETLKCASILHDVLEDTWITKELLKEKFGEKITKIVEELTKNEKLEKHERHKEYLERLKKSSDQAKIIKMADIYKGGVSHHVFGVA